MIDWRVTLRLILSVTVFFCEGEAVKRKPTRGGGPLFPNVVRLDQRRRDAPATRHRSARASAAIAP